MASCLFVTGTLLVTLSLIASGIAFFTTYWATLDVALGSVQYGLWGICGGTSCTWIWDNDFLLSKDVDPFNQGWFIAVQALFGVGFLLVLATEIYSRSQLCCDARPGLARSAGTLLILACLLMGAGIGVFGGYTQRDTYSFEFNWGFWAAVAGSGLSLIAGLLFIFAAGCTKDY